jgi:formylglycine-generating enzyme required for sulfatase activity
MVTGGNQASPITLFYSYAHADEDLRRELEKHLAVLRRGGLIAEWHDRMIDAGDDWKSEIDRNLTTADIVLLLVSADFIASDYCWGEEMTKALERHERGEAQVVPVILRYCRWQSTPLARLQAVPKDAKPIAAWPDRDEALYDVVAAIERSVEKVRRKAVNLPGETTSATESVEEAGAAEAVPKVDADPATLPDLAVFRDIDQSWCPEMVVLPAGTFMMGSAESDEEGFSDERPQHRVTIGAHFAVGRYPVTFEEYGRFAEATGAEKHEDEGWGRGRRPVINVSWEDAKAYVEWLSGETGEAYRLLSEAEWEYACRAGTETRYCFGDTITAKQANFDGKVGKTTEVGSYPANPWGLYDMHGNVWEWVEDVWHDDYNGAPDDGRAWTERGDQGRRVVRGGSWFSAPRNARSAIRNGYGIVNRVIYTGFRVARTF